MSAMPIEPTRRRITTRNKRKRNRYIAVPRMTSSQGDKLNPKISSQFIALTLSLLPIGKGPP
jgi:hypothetical protein